MKVLRIIRSSEWWEYKMPILLSLAYATALHANKSLYDIAGWFGFMLLCLIVGAAYVSIVNDMCDIEDDLASGKKNRLSKLRHSIRWMLLIAIIILALLCCFFYLKDPLTISFYLLSYLAFTLYSVPPIRLKKRGIWGVIADACGAHLFPSLFVVAGTAHVLQIEIEWIWISSIALWAFTYGLRGILWHQFLDRSSDKLIHLNTFASRINPISFRKTSVYILSIELAALVGILIILGKPWPIVGLFAYLVLMAAYKRKLGLKLIAIIPTSQPWHLIMITYYQVFFPIALLFESSLMFISSLIILLVHLILFPKCIWNIVNDAFLMLKWKKVNEVA